MAVITKEKLQNLSYKKRDILIEKAMNRNDHVQAKALIRSGLKKWPKDWRLAGWRSVVYYEEENYKKALQWAKKSYELEPDLPWTLYNYAEALDTLDRYEEALKYFKKILRKKFQPVNFEEGIFQSQCVLNDTRLCIGYCYLNLNRSGLAMHWMREYLKYRKTVKQSRYNIKETREDLKSLENELLICELTNKHEYKKALPLILKELKKDPDNAFLLDRLSMIYYEQHKYRKALAASKKANELVKNDPLYIWNYACDLMMVGRKEDAIQQFKRILKKGLQTVAFGKGGEGLQWAKSLVNDCRGCIGECYGDLKDYPLAIKWIRSHLRNRRAGIPSIFKAEEVKEMMRKYERKLLRQQESR